jgi:hypothetical protein
MNLDDSPRCLVSLTAWLAGITTLPFSGSTTPAIRFRSSRTAADSTRRAKRGKR